MNLNDLERFVYEFWHSVINSKDELCEKIGGVKINMQEWRKQKSIQRDRDNYSLLELGFSTFFLNRTNRSGILTGGVIGGKNQTGGWKIDARFNKSDLIQRIQRIARYANRISIYNLDAIEFIRTIVPRLPKKTLVY